MTLAEVLRVPEKQWVDLVPLNVLSVGAPKPNRFGFEQPVMVSDGTRTLKITLNTKFEDGLLGSNELGQMNWRLKWWGRDQNIQGYPLKAKTMTATPQPASLPVVAQSLPTQPTFKQEAEQWNFEDKEKEKSLQIIRQCCIKAAAAVFQGTSATENVICEYASVFESYVITGQVPVGDDIPL